MTTILYTFVYYKLTKQFIFWETLWKTTTITLEIHVPILKFPLHPLEVISVYIVTWGSNCCCKFKFRPHIRCRKNLNSNCTGKILF